jgi:hypothetical protein
MMRVGEGEAFWWCEDCHAGYSCLDIRFELLRIFRARHKGHTILRGRNYG